MIRRTIDDWLAGSELPPPDIIEVESAEAQKSFVEAGFGWSIVSDIAVNDPRQRRPYRIAALAPALERELLMVWRRDRTDYPVVAAARDCFAAYSAA